jgi:UDP-glucuronate decarboxylase
MAMGASSNKGPINLGNPNENTLLELASMVTKVVGGPGEIVYRELPQDDPKRRKPDIFRARSVLGWEPKVSLEEGIRRTADWMAKSLAL